MTPAKKAFRWTFLVLTGLGLLLGLLKLVAPEAVSITLNQEQMAGVPALVTSTILGAVLGLIFGLIIAGIVKLATRGSPAR